MSGLLGLAPVVRLRLENPLLGSRYPADGSLEGTIDTGYQGFVAVPRAVFDALRLDELKTAKRVVELADGTRLESRVANATAASIDAGLEVDGPVETIPGLSEVLLGTRFLSHFRLTLDYCLRATSLDPCR
jgi:clan AA aspartic protease